MLTDCNRSCDDGIRVGYKDKTSMVIARKRLFRIMFWFQTGNLDRKHSLTNFTSLNMYNFYANKTPR